MGFAECPPRGHSAKILYDYFFKKEPALKKDYLKNSTKAKKKKFAEWQMLGALGKHWTRELNPRLPPCCLGLPAAPRMPSHATARASGRSLASARASGHRLRAPAFSLAPARSRRPRSVAPARQRRPRPRTVPSSGASCLGVGGSGGRAGDVGGRLTACGRSRGNFPKKVCGPPQLEIDLCLARHRGSDLAALVSIGIVRCSH